MLVMFVLLVALGVLSRSIGTAMTLTDVNRETLLAADAAREMLEVLQGDDDFPSLFARFNSDPDDDPGIAGSAPGNGFAVAGLDPADDDPDGLVGEILLPETPGPTGIELHEDLDDEHLGMPRDLDASGDVDGANHEEDYELLPVLLRLRWKGATGVRVLELQTLVAER